VLSDSMIRMWEKRRFCVVQYMDDFYVFDRRMERRVSPYFTTMSKAREWVWAHTPRIGCEPVDELA